MLETVWNTWQGYYHDLPSDTLRSMGMSAVISFVATALMNQATTSSQAMASGQWSKPVASAVLAATASLVSAILTPIFNYIFKDHDMKFEKEAPKHLITMMCTYQLLGNFDAMKTQMAAMLFLPTSFNFVKSFIDIGPRIAEAFSSSLVAANMRSLYNSVGLGLDSDKVIYIAFG